MTKKGISIALIVLVPIVILIGLALGISRMGDVFTVVGSLQANRLQGHFLTVHGRDFQRDLVCRSVFGNDLPVSLEEGLVTTVSVGVTNEVS
jgi:hypothetical protein